MSPCVSRYLQVGMHGDIDGLASTTGSNESFPFRQSEDSQPSLSQNVCMVRNPPVLGCATNWRRDSTGECQPPVLTPRKAWSAASSHYSNVATGILPLSPAAPCPVFPGREGAGVQWTACCADVPRKYDSCGGARTQHWRPDMQDGSRWPRL